MTEYKIWCRFYAWGNSCILKMFHTNEGTSDWAHILVKCIHINKREQICIYFVICRVCSRSDNTYTHTHIQSSCAENQFLVALPACQLCTHKTLYMFRINSNWKLKVWLAHFLLAHNRTISSSLFLCGTLSILWGTQIFWVSYLEQI